MASQIAHDLTDKKWRSQDINVNEEENEVTFGSLNLKENVLSGLNTNGFIRLSAIQLQAIPLGRCGLDLILQSKSGTGKTCVFVVIALELIESFDSNSIQVLIICPTREIAVQTNQVMTGLGSQIPNFRSCAVIGGTKLKEDKSLLSKCQAVVGTPGRIKQLIDLNALKTKSIRLLVLDECDKLLDINFKQQIDAIFETLPQNKQMIAVSATMTTDLANFLTEYMRTPVFVRLNADNPALIGVKQFYRITESHHLNHINFDNKIDPLIEILKNICFSQCLVFSNYQTRARMLCDKLNASDWKTTYISADKCQSERLEALSKLKKYKCRILVSTDLTARGIDVENINLVINMDIPFDGQTYLHRIGRAGRFGTRGIAITIVSRGREEEQFRKIIKECKLKIEELKDAIPNNIWKMDDSNQDLSFIPNESQKENKFEESEEYDPFKEYFSVSNETIGSETFLTYSEILEEYNLMIKNESIVEPINQNNYLESESQQISDNILTDFTQNCFVSEKVLNSSEDQKENVTQNDVSINGEQIRYSTLNPDSDLIFKTSDEQNINRVEPINSAESHSTDSNGNHSSDSIQNVSNRLSNALFPPISSVNNPIGINLWIDSNRGLWSHFLDPFLFER